MTGREKKLVQRGKHKRRDRGSSKEGNSAAKKQNMAAREAVQTVTRLRMFSSQAKRKRQALMRLRLC